MCQLHLVNGFNRIDGYGATAAVVDYLLGNTSLQQGRVTVVGYADICTILTIPVKVAKNWILR